jgi:alpha-tubulin suppressor-like RCC1 family protein
VTIAPSTVTLSGYGYLSAVVRDSAGFVLVGRAVAWRSADTLIASVSDDGQVVSRFPGQTTITATSEGVAGSATIVVRGPASVASVIVSPDTLSIEVGQGWQFNATTLDSAARITAQPVTWSSSDSTRAAVSSNGVLSALSAGTVTITATSGVKIGRSTVRVFPTLPVGAIALAPDTATVQVGGYAIFSLIVMDIQGNRVVTRPISLSTSNSSNAQIVSQTKYDVAVSALSPGTVFIFATSGGRTGTATLRVVSPPTVAQLFVSPIAVSLPVGRTIVLTASALDGSGASIFPTTTWRSSDSTRASVGAYGSVTALATGTVSITATAGGRSAQSTITITPFTAQPLAIVAAGRDESCGMSDTGAALCWGQDYFGARGDGGSADTLARPVPGRVTGTATFTAISAGDYHVCAVSAAGSALCWGSNARGQLGAGPPSPACVRYGGSYPCSAVPVAVAGGLSVRRIAAGGSTTCAVTSSNSAYCWGDNTTGQLGIGNTTASDVPVQLNTNGSLTAITVGRSHACALTPAGKAYCWGSNSVGQTGAPTRTTCPDGLGRVVGCSMTPQAVDKDITFTSITAGGDHSCALTADGSAYCWGSNASGELGNGTQTLSDSPVAAANGLHFSAITAGANHTCGITAGGTYCWGSNSSEQLGAGIKSMLSAQPVLVLGGFTFESISAGGAFSCGVAVHLAYCWGNNGLGQLGTGDTKPSSVPKVAVTAP